MRPTHPVTCPSCGSVRQVRNDQTATYCKSCAGSRRAPPSAETRAKRAASMKKAWARPGKREAISAAVSRAHRAKFANDPEYAKAFSERSSKRMWERHHNDPEFQARRDKRSSEFGRRIWANPEMRAHLTAMAKVRYANGEGIATAQGDANKRIANQWIMKRCHEEMIAETDYAEKYREVQARLRLEHPYDGPSEGSDYMAYLARLGRLVVNDPQMRAIADTFMSTAIPRWSAEWQRRKTQTDEQSLQARNRLRPLPEEGALPRAVLRARVRSGR